MRDRPAADASVPVIMAVCLVLREDPDLGARIPSAELNEATRRCAATEVRLATGFWEPGEEAIAARDGFGLLMLEGLLVRRVGTHGRFGAELLGAGDLLRPWDEGGEDLTPPFQVLFTVAEEVRLAILDADFAARAARYPSVAASLAARAMLRSRTLAIGMAIAHYPQIRRRLLLLLWHIADRWGRVTPEGVRIPLHLPHELLADLVAARRPAVTTALGQLAEEGLVVRDRRGFLLTGDLLAALGPDG
jgi:CRP/FNR family transcriptional regulator, cyclic AMP receptor protein